MTICSVLSFRFCNWFNYDRFIVFGDQLTRMIVLPRTHKTTNPIDKRKLTRHSLAKTRNNVNEYVYWKKLNGRRFRHRSQNTVNRFWFHATGWEYHHRMIRPILIFKQFQLSKSIKIIKQIFKPSYRILISI